MSNRRSIFKREEDVLLHTYKRIPIEISYGEGVYLFTNDGKKYLDFFSGLGVNALGHGNEKVISAMEEQIKKFVHLSNYYVNSPQIELAEKLVKYSGLSKVFFSNSGTEAIEASIKLIRKCYRSEKNIITFTNAFHGRTYGSLSLSGKVKYKKYFSPLLPKIVQLEFNDVEQLEENVTENTAAIYLEFIQGEGGIHIISNNFVEKINELRNKYGFALVADEVQSGIGRTGKPFAYQHFNIEPDLVIVAKSIGGGLPLGALITNKKYDYVFQQGDHGSTFGGNPVACAAGLAVMEQVFETGLIDEVAKIGNSFKSELNLIHKKYPDKIAGVRGLGFMLGVELFDSCAGLVDEFREKKILVNCTNENVLRILPPLISKKGEIDFFINVFNEILRENG